MRFKAAHLSGRWDRSAHALHQQLRRAAKRGATLLTLTEVADGKRPGVVHLEGWTACHDVDGKGGKMFDRGECAILARDDTWKVLRWRSYVIGPDRGPGNRVIIVMALLEHLGTGKTLLVSTAHLMSAVEADWRGRRAGFYRQDLDRWRFIHASWVRMFKPDAEATVADWNLDLHRAWVRDALDGAWDRLNAPRQLPRGGTHGARLIDFPRTRNLGTVNLAIRSSLGASDHQEMWWSGSL